MFHSKRRWCLSEVESAERLGDMVSQCTWTLCSAFYVRDHPKYIFLNDATHEDGAAEYAVLLRMPDGTFVQIESITMSWLSKEGARATVEKTLVGDYDASDFTRPVTPRLDAPDKHRPCHLCA